MPRAGHWPFAERGGAADLEKGDCSIKKADKLSDLLTINPEVRWHEDSHHFKKGYSV